MQHRLLSIDPGTVNVGIAISDIGEKMVVRHAANFNVKKMVDLIQVRAVGRKSHIRNLICDFMLQLLKDWQPSAVISEVPYLNESLNSFLSLYECNMATKKAIREYSDTMQFIGIDPASAKKEIGVPGNSGDKQLIFNAITQAPYIDLSNIYIDQLSEHAVDAILMGNAYYKQYHRTRLRE